MNQLKEFKRQVEIASFVYESSGKYSDYDLSERFNVGISTLRRDLKSLRDMGVEIRSRRGCVQIDVHLKPLNSLLSTYIAISTKNNIRTLKQIRQKYKHKTMSLFVNILKAINEKKYLQMEYLQNEKDQVENITVAPIYLVPTNKSFYLIGFENGDLDFYRIEQIEKISLTSAKFNKEIPALTDIYKHSWGIYSGGEEITAELQFSKDKEKYFVHRFLAEEQEIHYIPKGIVVKMKVKLSYEFVAWVMGWGKEVIVIGPDVLREQVLSKAQCLLDNHNAS